MAGVQESKVPSDRIRGFLWRDKDPSNLAVTRIFFGLLMVVDIHHERGFAEVDHRFGDPRLCHFPLFDFLKPLPFQGMCILYLVMWLGAVGITLGYKFRLSCLSFAIPYWYIFLLDKTAWNNHSYLYGLLSVLLLASSAHHYWSLDAWMNPRISNSPVPNWNYLLLRFQIFVLYFYAGVKKLDSEWLGGYSMKSYGGHWVFGPFRLLLSESAVEYYLVHIGGFLLDFTIGFWLLWPKSRPFALFFGASFHLMNSQLFSIGMFPYMCLATLPVFCDDVWPKRWIRCSPPLLQKCLPAHNDVQSAGEQKPKRRKSKASLMALYAVVQLTLPFTHSITQGYNNWTNGLYGYSWDMMVHAWETMHVVVSVEHKPTGRINYLDTEAFVRTDKWVGHADMVYQYAHCVRDRLAAINMTQVAVYVDVWRSLNGRFQQRLIDPRVDLLQAEWSPFRPTPWLMPLLTELTPWRGKLADLEKSVFAWSDAAAVVFVADFPGLGMDNYIPATVTNATLQVLYGRVDLTFAGNDTRLSLAVNDSAALPSEVMHTVETKSDGPACYMYTYFGVNATTNASVPVGDNSTNFVADKDRGTVGWSTPFIKSMTLVGQSLLNLVFGIPLVPHK